MPLFTPPPQDFSSRGKAIPPPNLAGRTPPLAPPPAVGSSTFNYNKPPTIPVFNPTTAAAPPLVLKEIIQPQSNSTPIPTSQFSPNVETFPTSGNSYFITGSQIQADIAGWSQYPAETDLSMNGHNITNVSTLITESTFTTTLITESTFTTNLEVTSGEIILDVNGTGNILKGVGGDLFYDNALIAKASDIQDIAAWSEYPAISTVNMNSNDLLNTRTIAAEILSISSITYPSAINITTDLILGDTNSIQASNVNVKDIYTNTIASEQATINVLNPIDMNSKSISGVDIAVCQDVITTQVTILPSFSEGLGSGSNLILTASNDQLLVDGVPVATGGNASTWSQYPAISTVNIPDQNFIVNNSSGGIGPYCNAVFNANVDIGALSNAPYRPSFNAYIDNFTIGSIVSPALGVSINSVGGINLNSLLGISLAGGGGISILGVGGVNLQGAGGITIAAGGIAVTGGGIAITSGGLAVNGGGIQIGAGGLAVTGGNVTIPGASTIIGTPSSNGGPLIMYGNNIYLETGGGRQSALITDNIGSTSFANTMRITGVSTINNIPFPPPGTSSNIVCSNLTASLGISTNQLYANIITGTGVIIGSEPGQGITLGTGATEVNVTTDMYIASPATLNAPVLNGVIEASISTIIDVSTINGQPYFPLAPSIPSNLVVSTLTAASGISTNQLYANIITGTGVIIGSEPGQGITLGTGATEVNVTTDMYIASPYILNAAVLEGVDVASISTIIDLSTINGNPYNLGTSADNLTNTAWGTANEAYLIANAAVLNAAAAQSTATYAVGQSGVTSVNGSLGAISVVPGSNISINTVANTITINAPLSAFSYNFYVSGISGSDVTGTGTISNPYRTIGATMTFVNTISDTNQVVINLAAGTYTENISITRDNTYITGGSTSLSTATIINGTITIDMTGTSQLIVVGGLSSVQITNIVYNNSVAKNQSFIVTDCLIVPGLGVSAIVTTDTSVGGNGDMTIQNSLIYMSDAVAVSCSNCSLNCINTQITNNPVIISPLSMITTTGTGRVNLFGCSVIQTSTVSTVAPLIKLANNSSTQTISINNSILQYTSATLDTGTGTKCCLQIANSAPISGVSVYNNLLICEGARTTNGIALQYLAIQRTGAGTVTLTYGQNLCGATANHLPAAATGLTKTPYVVLGN